MAPVAASRAGPTDCAARSGAGGSCCVHLLLVSCGTADPAESDGADEPYRVLVTGGISAQGALAANAKTSILAAKAGAQVQNEAGGIGGRRIELTVVDDGGDPTKAVTELRKAITAQSRICT